MRTATRSLLAACALWALLCAAGTAVGAEEIEMASEWPWKAPELPSFPGAEGFGSRAVGGRGGKVIKVTNLNANGPGSFLAALETPGPKIIVFGVSGVIPCHYASKGKKYMPVVHPHTTIAGQTAPGAGITLDGTLTVRRHATTTPLHNIIIRFLRIRATCAKNSGRNVRGIELTNGNTVILDHVSACWSIDDGYDLYTTRNATVQWCSGEESGIWYEGGDEPHNFGMIMTRGFPKPITVHHHLMANHRQRCPSCGGSPIDWRNNVLYNCGEGGFGNSQGAHAVVGNYIKGGPANILGARMYMPPYTAREATLDFGKGGRAGKCHAAGNYRPWSGGYLDEEDVKARCADYVAEEHDTFPPVETHTAEEAYRLVLAHSGCLPRDAVLARTVREVMTKTGQYGAHLPGGGLMEGLTPGKAPADSDSDGMPDEWEEAHKLNPDDPADNVKVVPAGASPGDRHKGYTWIEYYINELADIKVAEALTRARFDPQPAEPWDKPAKGLTPFAKYHDSLESMVAAIKEQTMEVHKTKMTYTYKAFFAVQQLTRMGEEGKPIVPDLARLAECPDERTAAFAAWALGAIGPSAAGAIPSLVKNLRNKTDYGPQGGKWKFVPHGFAAWALGRMGPAAKETVPVLAETMLSGVARARGPAAWALAQMGKDAEPAKGALLKVMGNGSSRPMRVHAIEALANIGGPAVPDLITAAGGGRPTTRADAAEALGLIGKKAAEALPVLVKLAADQDKYVRGQAATAMVRVDPAGEGVVAALSGLVSDKSVSVRHKSIKALGEVGSPAEAAVGALEKALADPRREIRRAAALALGRIGAKSLPALEKALGADDPLVRKYAARALGDVRPAAASAVPALRKALADRDADVRREAVWSLGLIGSGAAGAAGDLKKAAAGDVDYVVRYAAAEALKRVGG
jgi:HEAT repeat protein